MKNGQKLWTRDELVLAINLYWKLEFGKIHEGNPEVQKFARLIGRTPGSVVFKLGNFGSFDPSLQARGVGGLKNTSKLDKEIWDEFFENMEDLSFESEVLRAKYENNSVENLNGIEGEDLPKEGKVRERLIKVRVNQNFFRRMILGSYRNTCCITGINHPDFLVAGHIIPWSESVQYRMDPSNGICLNYLHDKAFELGYISIDRDYKILVSNKIKELVKGDIAVEFFTRFDKKEIIKPGRYLPNPDFLEHHRDTRFKI